MVSAYAAVSAWKNLGVVSFPRENWVSIDETSG